jgi:hypothetical protein
MAATSVNFLAVVLKELGWSYTKLIAELRREAAVDGIVLPKTESLMQQVSRWVNNHQQPDDLYRDLLSRATGRPRFQLFGDEAATFLLATSSSSGIAPSVAIGSDEDVNRRQLLARPTALSRHSWCGSRRRYAGGATQGMGPPPRRLRRQSYSPRRCAWRI